MNVLLAKVSCDTPFFRLRLIKPQKPLEHGKPKPSEMLRGEIVLVFWALNSSLKICLKTVSSEPKKLNKK
jgi:hypothetical protein